jgi:hypothetical protein
MLRFSQKFHKGNIISLEHIVSRGFTSEISRFAVFGPRSDFSAAM